MHHNLSINKNELVCPPYMANYSSNCEHIVITNNIFIVLYYIIFSKVTLVWRNYSIWKYLAIFNNVINITTDELDSIEYGRYCGLYWKYILVKSDRQQYLNESYQRFNKISKKVKQKNYLKSCVFGTGPSLERAYDFDFSGCLTIVCNSIVSNDTLLDHINPQFITAGDVVSHLGVSKYSEYFRRDLVKSVHKRDIYFVTTASFGLLFLLHHPEARDKTILIPQTCAEPNYDLINNFSLPELDSTLNSQMLPLAATFTNQIVLLGCDGKSNNRSNEDFWAHASQAQYFNLVDSGHKCHPTFDVHRQKKTYAKYIDSTNTSITTGETHYGKTYRTIFPSNINGLEDRHINIDVDLDKPCKLVTLKLK